MMLMWTSWTTIAVLIMYFWTIFKVGKARTIYKVPAPSVEGPPEFLRALRVQMNTVEQLIFFLPALWLCAYWYDDKVAAMGGIIWLVGRMLYALGYYNEPKKRALGFVVSMMATFVLLAFAAYGLLLLR